jgi:hypothetical protein
MLFALLGYQFPYIVMYRCLYFIASQSMGRVNFETFQSLQSMNFVIVGHLVPYHVPNLVFSKLLALCGRERMIDHHVAEDVKNHVLRTTYI